MLIDPFQQKENKRVILSEMRLVDISYSGFDYCLFHCLENDNCGMAVLGNNPKELRVVSSMQREETAEQIERNMQKSKRDKAERQNVAGPAMEEYFIGSKADYMIALQDKLVLITQKKIFELY